MTGTGNSGTTFGVDLYTLDKAGRGSFPSVVGEFAKAYAFLAWSSMREKHALAGSEYVGVDVQQQMNMIRTLKDDIYQRQDF